MKLSKIDKKILRFLALNGAHFSEYKIAKRLRLSQTTVNYKLRKFRDIGIIRRYNYILNPAKIGYRYMAWCFLKTKRQTIISPKDIGTIFISYPNVYSVWEMSGGYDILLKVFYDDPAELNSFIIWVNDKFKQYIGRISVSMVTHRHKLHQIQITDEKRTKLSKKDLDILRYKQKNPDAKIKQIAEKLNMHRNTVSSRWKKLWDKNVIIKKSVDIDPSYLEDLDICFKTVILIDTIMGKKESAVEDILGMDEVHELTSISSQHDLLSVVKTRDINSCYNFIKKLYRTGHVERTKTLLVFTSIEESLMP